jgi:hypothetical protein
MIKHPSFGIATRVSLREDIKKTNGTKRYGCPTASTEKTAWYLPVRHIIKINFFHIQESTLQ